MTDPAPGFDTAFADGVALWRRIATTLGGEIAAGVPQPGARLPSEASLAARFGVNRHTVRRAVETLSRHGLVRVQHGRGAFVAEHVLDYAITPRTRFSEVIRRHNREPSGRVLRLEETVADEAVAEGLELVPGDRVVLLERVGFADGRPVGIALHHFPADGLPGLLPALASGAGISEALAQIGIADYRRRTTRVTAVLPTAEEAALLRMPPNQPLLLCENTNVDTAGRVIDYTLARYPTPRVQLVFEP